MDLKYPQLDSNFNNTREFIVSNAPSKSKSKPSLIASPLRYPGGKSRAVQAITQYMPSDLNEICSPFLGGGSIELALASRGVKVEAYDYFEPLVNFWQILLDSPKKLAENVRPHHPLTKSKFYNLQKKFNTIKDKMKQAAIFYVLNRASFSGTTLSGGMSPEHPRFTEKGLEALADFKANHFSVKHANFKKSLEKNANVFLYCDPPYLNKEELYGERGNAHKGFDHQGLSDMLNSRDGWILSYNDCDKVRELYKNNHIITPRWAYGMGACKASKEILILSKDFMALENS